jgi:Mg2+ and Co2+ transporter CorA
VQLRKKKSPLFHKFSQLLLGRADEAAAAELPEEAEVPRVARYRLLNADCELRDVAEAELRGLAAQCRNPNSFFWLDLQTSSKAALLPLMEQFGIQQLTGFDDFYLSNAERVDLQPWCVFVSITELDPSREEIALNVALFSRCIVTFHSCPSSTVERLLETMDRLEEEVTAPEWILLGVMHFAMASFLLHVENMHTEVKNINALSLQYAWLWRSFVC